MPKRPSFWRDSVEDLTDEDLIDEVREYALLNGCSLGEATYRICGQWLQDPQFAGMVEQVSGLARRINIDPLEFARRSIRVLHSTAGDRLAASAKRLEAEESNEITQLAEQYEFEGSFASDPEVARSLSERARDFRDWLLGRKKL